MIHIHNLSKCALGHCTKYNWPDFRADYSDNYNFYNNLEVMMSTIFCNYVSYLGFLMNYDSYALSFKEEKTTGQNTTYLTVKTDYADNKRVTICCNDV